MVDKTPRYTPEVLALMERQDETVPASALAPIVKMHPSVIVEYARTGRWTLCKYIVSGNRVKFFRKDFLRTCGFIPEEPPEADKMDLILRELIGIREAIAKMIQEKDPPAGANC